MTGDFGAAGPRISLIVTSKNLENYIDAALWSARCQSLRHIEVIIVDDGSTDDTRPRIARHVKEDARLTLLDGPGRGPAAARNLGLRAARGEWIAILDGDDIMHPRRLELLLAEAVAQQADILADNQILFFEDGSPSQFLVEGDDWKSRRRIALGDYIRANIMYENGAPLGYLKPLFRRSLFSDSRSHYDESLRIGEDYDLVARLLRNGAKFSYVPGAFYFYRRHQRSISFRLGSADIASLVIAADRFHAELSDAPDLRAVSQRRRDALIRVGHFTRCVERLKAGALVPALLDLARHPSIWPLLLDAARDGLGRRLRARRKPASSAKAADGPPKLTDKTYALLTADKSSPAALTISLERAGWQGRVVTCAGFARELAVDVVAPELLDMALAKGVHLVLYDDDRLIDLLPYLLSPEARLARIVMQGSEAPSRPHRLSLSPLAETPTQIILTAADLANPQALARQLAQVS
ncbi:MAG TPA: glycosyltransferase [Dongiaceae bacterium]|nr:glycosyltransferase [Dongiaceae bacterium]